MARANAGKPALVSTATAIWSESSAGRGRMAPGGGAPFGRTRGTARLCVARSCILSSLMGSVLDEIVDHGRIGQSARVADLIGLIGRDLAQNAAHDLAGPGLG